MDNQWWCGSCVAEIELDSHGRCGACGSDAVDKIERVALDTNALPESAATILTDGPR